MGGGRFPSSFTRRISILSVVTGVKQSRGLADQTVPPLLVFATPLPTTTIPPPPPPNPPGCRLSRSPVQSSLVQNPDNIYKLLDMTFSPSPYPQLTFLSAKCLIPFTTSRAILSFSTLVNVHSVPVELSVFFLLFC